MAVRLTLLAIAIGAAMFYLRATRTGSSNPGTLAPTTITLDMRLRQPPAAPTPTGHTVDVRLANADPASTYLVYVYRPDDDRPASPAFTLGPGAEPKRRISLGWTPLAGEARVVEVVRQGAGVTEGSRRMRIWARASPVRTVSSLPAITVDLATLPPGSTAVRTVPRLEHWAIKVSNLALAATYRVTTEKLNHSTEVRTIPRPTVRHISEDVPAACRPGLDAIRAVVASTTEEESARSRAALRAFRAKGCDEVERVRERLDGQYGPRQVAGSLSMRGSTTIIERMDGDAVAARWTIDLRIGRAPLPIVGNNAGFEEQWIVTDIARAVIRAAGGDPRGVRAEGGEDGRWRLDLGRQDLIEIVLPGSVWDPVPYVGLAERIRASRNAPLAPGDALPGTLKALLTPTLEVIDAQAASVSDRLARNSSDAAAHEAAALVWAALGLREAAGVASDARPALNRLTASLAAAAAIRAGAPPGLEGQLALLASLALTGRQADAVAGIDSARRFATDPETRAWLTALRIRATGDWRPFVGSRDATLLERRERFRAGVAALGSDAAMEWLGTQEPEPIPDWAWIVFDDLSRASVGAANTVAPAALQNTLGEAARLFVLPRDATPKDVAAMLVGRGDDLTRPVASVAHLAAFYRRHAVNVARAAEHWQRDQQGNPEAARALAAQSDELVGAFEEAPVLRLWRAAGPEKEQNAKTPGDAKAQAEACHELAGAVALMPDRLTIGAWRYADHTCGLAGVPDIPLSVRWFDPLLPRGTTYDAGRRLSHSYALLAMTDEDVAAARRLAPYSADLAPEPLAATRTQWPGLSSDASKTAPAPTVETSPADAPYLAFNVYALSWTASVQWKAGRSASAVATQRKACDLGADHCFTAGWMYRRLGQEGQAVAMEERGARHARDAVAMSNAVAPLALYYVRRGQHAKALEVAQRAADVGSNDGLITLALVYEALGRRQEAERMFEQAAERYGNRGPLQLFRIRAGRAEADPRWANAADEALAALVPAGLVKASLADFSGRPQAGAVVSKDSDLETFGLREGDVMVALDGHAIRSADEFRAVRALSNARTMRVIVFRAGTYLEMALNVPDRYFSTAVADLVTTRQH